MLTLLPHGLGFLVTFYTCGGLKLNVTSTMGFRPALFDEQIIGLPLLTSGKMLRISIFRN